MKHKVIRLIEQIIKNIDDIYEIKFVYDVIYFKYKDLNLAISKNYNRQTEMVESSLIFVDYGVNYSSDMFRFKEIDPHILYDLYDKISNSTNQKIDDLLSF